MVTWCWLLAGLAERLTGRRAVGAGERRALAAAIVAAAAAVYGAALGGPAADVYRWGYGGTELSVAAVAAAAAAWLWHCDFTVAAVATALLAFRCELLESANLWDYLLDPVLAALAATVLVRESWKARSGGGQAGGKDSGPTNTVPKRDAAPSGECG